MLDIFNLEKQAGKRVSKFLLYKAEEEKIEPACARLVINIITEKVSVHLYDQHKFIETLNIRDIVEYFGKEYDETKVKSVYEYIEKISNENDVEFLKVNIVICESKSVLGVHLYGENKYINRLSIIELLSHLY